jgi:diguanylate cyclase (GGDEF)-like protein
MQAVIILCVLIACSVFCLIISFRLSHEIINIDPLTQIPNFDYFLGYCEKPFIRRNLSNYAIMSIDIKGFQYFNQQLGTSFGDALLVEYAAQLKKNKSRKRYREFIARVNGDSFIAIHKTDRIPVITDYLRQVDMNVRFGDSVQKVTVYSRCGVCPLEKGMSIMDAVENSRTALREAKKLSNTSSVWYTPKMSEKERNSKETIAKFSKAIKNNEFLVYYQPKVDMTTNRLSGCEALVRWMHDGKLIPPFSFIPVLEDEGYVTELDFYVFEKVCKDLSEWISKGIEPVRISSNFSKLHLKNKRFADDVLEIISQYNIDKKYIEIELTESSGYDDFEAMTEFVNKMKIENIHTAIDDFGTGYSSLSLLKDLDIDVVKLDKSFLNGANTDLQKQMIENIIRMIRDLHHDVICEGVETEQQAQFLKSVNCFMAQGYLYDKPLPHDDFEKRLVSPVYEMERN